MHHTDKKESKKEMLEKDKKKITNNLLQGDSNLGPQNQLKPNINASS